MAGERDHIIIACWRWIFYHPHLSPQRFFCKCSWKLFLANHAFKNIFKLTAKSLQTCCQMHFEAFWSSRCIVNWSYWSFAISQQLDATDNERTQIAVIPCLLIRAKQNIYLSIDSHTENKIIHKCHISYIYVHLKCSSAVRTHMS